MDIGRVIRKYRKEAGLTQEELADRLGVTAPAVNKWENGNSNPDIGLLAPIARLLHISLDTLMAFREELTSLEIGEILRELDRMLDTEGFEKGLAWVSDKIREYPNCNMLIWQAAVMLDARSLMDDGVDSEKYGEQISVWYEMALTDEKEEVRRHAADSLFGFYMRKKDYTKAEECLQYFSDEDSMKKIYQGRLYQERGEKEKAYTILENILFSEYQTLTQGFSLLLSMSLEEGDIQRARYLAEKMGAVAGVFEMGKYREYSSMLEVVCAEKNIAETNEVVKQLLQGVDTLMDFERSELYRHMSFHRSDGSFTKNLREKLLEGFRDEGVFGYMKGNEVWETLIG